MSALDTLKKNITDQGNGPVGVVFDEDVLCILEKQHKELQLIRRHLECVTGEKITFGDLDVG